MRRRSSRCLLPGLPMWPPGLDEQLRCAKEVPKYIHQKHFVPVPEPTPPQYHNVPVPVKVTDPGKIIKVPSPMPQQTIVKNKAWRHLQCLSHPCQPLKAMFSRTPFTQVIYKTKHIRVQHVYDCAAGFSNWRLERISGDFFGILWQNLYSKIFELDR